jgi:hypothetical protein
VVLPELCAKKLPAKNNCSKQSLFLRLARRIKTKAILTGKAPFHGSTQPL